MKSFQKFMNPMNRCACLTLLEIEKIVRNFSTFSLIGEIPFGVIVRPRNSIFSTREWDLAMDSFESGFPNFLEYRLKVIN